MSRGGFDYESAVWGAETIDPRQRTIAAFRLDEALRFLPDRGRVLEMGCGAGRFLRAVQRARPQLALCGADVSQRALDVAAELSPGIELRRVPGPRSPFPAESGEFDAVLALDVLEHVEDPGAFLQETARVLVPGGIFHLHVPCEGDPLSLWRWLPGQGGPEAWKRRFAGHVQRFRRRALHELLGRHGFTLLRARHSLHLAGNLADVAAFAVLARRRRRGEEAAITADLVSTAQQRGAEGRVVRAVEAVLWAEARLLGRLPSWALHLSLRRG